ncbi:MAG: S41 family peptidase [Phaeodactylibacter sp.]|nr:S41 family peptidase [Phaeodactylibacter sp.]
MNRRILHKVIRLRWDIIDRQQFLGYLNPFRHMPSLRCPQPGKPVFVALSRVNFRLPASTLALLILLLSGACEKAVLGGDPDTTPTAVFDALWEDVNNRYSYFEEKSIDWDAVRAAYHPLVHNGMSDRELFGLLAEMLFTLEDGHVNLTSAFGRSRNWEWFLDYPPNFNANIVERHYLGRDFHQIGPFRAQRLGDVLYVYYGSFANTVEDTHLDALLALADGSKGLIIDIRDNGGGSEQNAKRIAACLASEPLVYARSRIKTGPGREEFSEWEDQLITPRQGRRYAGKVAVLTSRSTFSAANTFAQMARVLPGAILIGDRTGGGGGTPVYAELPNGWTYRFSATQSVSPSGEHLEFGVPVDIEAALAPEDEQAGVDTIIERALEWVRG